MLLTDKVLALRLKFILKNKNRPTIIRMNKNTLKQLEDEHTYLALVLISGTSSIYGMSIIVDETLDNSVFIVDDSNIGEAK
jgi:hypothetical protein